MKIYRQQNVFDAALDRIRYLFNEFPVVVCNVSGGKDSTVVFHLCLQVARELGRLPLKVMFIDQEAEWAATVEQIKAIMYHPDVEPRWYQMPFKLFNATSTTEHWLQCWDPAAEARWMRVKDPVSVKENVYGTDRFAQLFTRIMEKEYHGIKACYIAGVRTEESPARFCGLTHYKVYKWITWGKKTIRMQRHYTFYPVYDWSYTDVWKAIHSNGWPYNRLYDLQYQYGVAIQSMRVSNLHHETAVHSLFHLQEIEPETYERLAARLPGIDMAGKMGKADFYVHDLPFMFSCWREYRDHLLDKLITDPDWRVRFRRQFTNLERRYAGMRNMDDLFKMQCQSILVNDWEGIKTNNWERGVSAMIFRRWKRREPAHRLKSLNRTAYTYLPESAIQELEAGTYGRQKGD